MGNFKISSTSWVRSIPLLFEKLSPNRLTHPSFFLFLKFIFCIRHEIVGAVTEVGNSVTKFKVGDIAGIGCMVESCRSCDNCTKDLENYCSKVILTFSSVHLDGTPTYGGYSDIIVADEHFVVKIPENLPLDAVAPLLCAGITTYSPLRHFGLDKPGLHVGVVGLGGLGHLAVKFAKAFQSKVTVISTSPHKKKEALEHLGADSFLVSTDSDELQVVYTDQNFFFFFLF